MQKRLFASSLILGLIVGQTVWGADPVKLTIDDAIYKAFATNPAVKIAGYERDAARANMNATRLERGITITGKHESSRGGYERQQYIGGVYKDKLSTTHSSSITASMPIYTGGALSGRMISAKARYQQSVSGMQKAYNDMHYKVVSDYYNCLLAEDLERVAQDSVDTLASHLKNVQASYDVGVVAKVDVLRSEVELADAQQSLIKAENARKIAVHTLNKTVGLPLETELDLTDSLVNDEYGRDLASCLEYAELNRPDLEQSRQGVRAAKGGVRSARSGYMPQISINASKSWGNTDSKTGTTHGWPGDQDEKWGVGATATWNVFDCGVTLSKIHEAEANARAAKEQLRDSENAVALDVRNTYYNMQESQRRIHTTNVAVAKAQEDFDIAQLRYQNGVGTNTDVLDAQVALNKAKTNYIQACYDFNTNKIALDNAIGVPYKSPLEKKAIKAVKVKKVKKAK